MAKVGEGDPRWIVSNRQDGANVNAWHWVEKDITTDTISFLKEKLSDFPLNNEYLSLTLYDVEISGESSANIRKAKMVYIYDLVLNFKLKGKFKGEHDIQGKVTYPDISSIDFEEEDPELQLKFLKNPIEGNRGLDTELRTQLKKILVEEVISLLRRSIKELKEIHDYLKKSNTASAGQVKIRNPNPQYITPSATPVTVRREEKSAPNISHQQLKMVEFFRTDPIMIFNLLTDGASLSRLTRSQCVMHREKGKPFSLFNGAVTGTIESLKPNNQIVQKWRFSSWPKDFYSSVTITIDSHPNGTRLQLVQDNIPEADFMRTKEGWKTNFWNGIKAMFGIPSKL